jgi:DNA polymerase elongation subunit (family B)
MQGDEMAIHNFVEESRTLFRELPPEEVAFPRGVKGLMQYKDNANIYTKSTPIHVRGSLLYNHYLNKKGLDMRYSLIKNGEKIKFCYLKLPNTINENVIAFIDFLPKEFDLHKYVDYEIQFQKSFVEPLQAILDTIDWNVEPTASLDSFFA